MEKYGTRNKRKTSRFTVKKWSKVLLRLRLGFDRRRTKKFELAEIGDEIHIETPMVPVVIDEGDGYFIGMYTDEAEIPKEFKRKKQYN